MNHEDSDYLNDSESPEEWTHDRIEYLKDILKHGQYSPYTLASYVYETYRKELAELAELERSWPCLEDWNRVWISLGKSRWP